MKDLSQFIISCEDVDSEYYKIVLKLKISDKISSIYDTDGQISYLLKMPQIDYMKSLQGQFKYKFFNNITLISKEHNFEDVKSLLESFLLMNVIGNRTAVY